MKNKENTVAPVGRVEASAASSLDIVTLSLLSGLREDSAFRLLSLTDDSIASTCEIGCDTT